LFKFIDSISIYIFPLYILEVAYYLNIGASLIHSASSWQ